MGARHRGRWGGLDGRAGDDARGGRGGERRVVGGGRDSVVRCPHRGGRLARAGGDDRWLLPPGRGDVERGDDAAAYSSHAGRKRMTAILEELRAGGMTGLFIGGEGVEGAGELPVGDPASQEVLVG